VVQNEPLILPIWCGQILSVDFRYCGAGRFDPHHAILLESASTVQFEQLIWQMPIWGSKRCGQKMTAPYHQRKHQRVKTAVDFAHEQFYRTKVVRFILTRTTSV
jgi:hypothetical protein